MSLPEGEQILNSIPRAESAHYRSATNVMKAGFKEGTRERVFAVLGQWELEQTSRLPSKPICVFAGEAGTGKSTIASEFSKRLQEHGHLGASFFFTRGVEDVNSPRKFFSTVAWQLARSHLALRDQIIDAAREHLKVAPLQRLEHECKDLLEEPLNTLSPSHPPIFVVVDALDECTEEGPHLVPTLLRLLLSCAVRPGSPLRVFLTSRPEPHYIFKAFTDPNLKSHIDILSIQDFRDAVDHDIEHLIRTTIEKDDTSKQWSRSDPSIIPSLVAKSEGLFIFSRTAVDFILGDLSDLAYLQERYAVLMSVEKAFGLTRLDMLYRTVLESVIPQNERYPQIMERLSRVLGFLVAVHDSPYSVPRMLEKLTGISTVESLSILNKLRSVVFFQRDNVDSQFRIIHATFREFLVDSKRSGETFYVNAEYVHRRLADDCARNLRFLRDTYWKGTTGTALFLELLVGPSGPRLQDLPHIGYALRYLDYHRENSGNDLDPGSLEGVLKHDTTFVFEYWREPVSGRKRMWRGIERILANLRQVFPTEVVDALLRFSNGAPHSVHGVRLDHQCVSAL